jgi:hypothetical protein
MYIWPEINPGGLIDAYRDVLPSDWRFVASVREAVRDRLEGRRSAKQKPAETAARLNEFAARTEQAAARAGARLAADHREWQSSEPDFLVLAALARYHAFKQTAAYELTRFDESGDLAALDAARGDLRAALGVWEKLARLTDGLYPAEMAFGPDDVGHWKDKLPYVRHDLELIEERARVHEQVGPFELAFDFGAPVERAGNPAAYRRAPYVLRNNVAPRFRPVEPGTRYEESRGYGWAAEGARAALGMPLAPYHEVRAVARRPQRLPRNTLFGDFIVGKGAQEFHIRSGPGDFQVLLLHPDGTSTSVQLRAEGDLLKVAFPDGDWSCSGVVVKGARAKAAPPAGSVSKPLPRPRFFHVPPKTAPAGRPLALRLGMAPAGNVAAVRLHYRAVNQLARFKTIEQAPPRLAFLIPAEDIPPDRDLMYYFEILAKDDGGWFEPDPQAVTPYHVVEVTPAGAAAAQ